MKEGGGGVWNLERMFLITFSPFCGKTTDVVVVALENG